MVLCVSKHAGHQSMQRSRRHQASIELHMPTGRFGIGDATPLCGLPPAGQAVLWKLWPVLTQTLVHLVLSLSRSRQSCDRAGHPTPCSPVR